LSTYTIVNEEFLPIKEASVLITDLAVQRGYGIFDFLKTINGKLIFLEDHLDRFYCSAEAMHLTVAQNREKLKALLLELMEKNQLPNSGIRITLTGGYSLDGYTIVQPNMIIAQQALTIASEIDRKGIKVITYPHQRQLPHVKTLDYLMAVWLQPLIVEKKVDDLLYHHNGFVKESPRSNFFIVNEANEVLTSGENILKGVVRKQVLSLGNNVFEREITLDDLRNCKEAFITSSTKNILPVTEIDGRTIGNGFAGETTVALWEKLQDLITAEYSVISG
jgi:branched-chain amino acid aminotransferase